MLYWCSYIRNFKTKIRISSENMAGLHHSCIWVIATTVLTPRATRSLTSRATCSPTPHRGRHRFIFETENNDSHCNVNCRHRSRRRLIVVYCILQQYMFCSKRPEIRVDYSTERPVTLDYTRPATTKYRVLHYIPRDQLLFHKETSAREC